MKSLKDTVRSYVKKARLKYNYFSCHHPKKSLQCKLFKFVGDGKVRLIKDQKTISVSKKDLYQGSKKLYWPADGA